MPSQVVGITRRTALRGIAACAAGAVFAGPLAAWAGDGPTTPPAGGRPARARSCIEIWLSGGPSHVDTFDPKPGAGRDWTGPLAASLPTNVDGVHVGELLPLLAKQADKYALIRSLSHGNNGHETATYLTQTGRGSDERVVHPGVGSVVACLKGYGRGYEGLIPPYVVLTTPLGRFSEPGFLGPRYGPFVTGGDPNAARFEVEGIVAPGVSDEAQAARRELLRRLDTLGRDAPGGAASREFERSGEAAYDLVLGGAGKVFDLSTEPDAVRERYGRSRFGQSCLMARRLVEAGVPYVTVHDDGWDTHKQHFEAMRRKLPQVDRGVATLLADLADRGLLATTLVWCAGEFGRTPRVQWEAPWNGGRGHHGACFSALVAGGGLRGGRVVGATDEKGEAVASRPVHPRELHRTIFELMGIDPDSVLGTTRGVDVRVTEPATRGTGRIEELL